MQGTTLRVYTIGAFLWKNHMKLKHEGPLKVLILCDEQKMLESPVYGDIDNHAKQMLDTFKGQGGLLIDDCQVQHLDISWIDIPFGAHFEVEFKAGPDDFLPLPLKLFEMSDGLFYPISTRVWTQKGLIEASTEILSFQANIPAELTQTKKAFRHKLRLSGVPQFRAFQASQYVSPILMGFHRSRVVDSGYELVSRPTWSSDWGINL